MIRETVRAFCAAAALGWLINRGGIPVPIATWGSIVLVGGAWLAFKIEAHKQAEEEREERMRADRQTIIRRSGGQSEEGDRP